MRAVIDIFMLEFRRQRGGEVVHFHDHAADAGDQKIVSEHRRNGDAQGGHGGDERAGNTRRHRGQVWRTSLGDAGESIHHAPNRPEQTEKRRSTHSGGEQNHLRFEFERGLADRPFHRRCDCAHLR